MRQMLVCCGGSVVVGIVIGYSAGRQRSKLFSSFSILGKDDPVRAVELTVSESDVNTTLADATGLQRENGDQTTTCYAPCTGESFPDLRGNPSAMAKFLTKPIYNALCQERTSFGCSIDRCIQVGIDHPSRDKLGILAGDEECYVLFQALFTPVIRSQYPTFVMDSDPFFNPEDKSSAGLMDSYSLESKVKGCSFSMRRSVRGFRYPPTCGRAERKQVEEILQNCFKGIQAEFGGSYKSVSSPHCADSDDKVIRSIAEAPLSPAAISCGLGRDWPHGRGIYKSKDGEILAWTNKYEHLEVLFQSQSKDTTASFKKLSRFMQGMTSLLKEQGHRFAFHDDFGFLSCDPCFCGTTLLVQVKVQLPNLMKDVRLKGILRTLRLNMNPVSKTMAEISNKDVLGVSENFIVRNIVKGVNLLVTMEERLSHKDSINDLLVEPTPK